VRKQILAVLRRVARSNRSGCHGGTVSARCNQTKQTFTPSPADQKGSPIDVAPVTSRQLGNAVRDGWRQRRQYDWEATKFSLWFLRAGMNLCTSGRYAGSDQPRPIWPTRGKRAIPPTISFAEAGNRPKQGMRQPYRSCSRPVPANAAIIVDQQSATHPGHGPGSPMIDNAPVVSHQA